MALKKPMHLILLLFTVMCALPAATTAALIPSAIAQEDDDDMSLDEAENLASDTVSNVLDNDNTAGDSTNTQLSVPLTDQDQRAANLGLSGALDVTVERTLSPQEEEEPPEFEAFCFVTGNPLFGQNSLLCYPTMEDCDLGESFFVPVIEGQECKGFETRPPDAWNCEILRQPPVTGVPTGSTCFAP